MKYYCDRCHEWFDEDELDDENQYGDRECPRCGNDLIDETKMKRLMDEQARLYAKHPKFDKKDPFYNIYCYLYVFLDQ